jgi:hypothetical protein
LVKIFFLIGPSTHPDLNLAGQLVRDLGTRPGFHLNVLTLWGREGVEDAMVLLSHSTVGLLIGPFSALSLRACVDRVR